MAASDIAVFGVYPHKTGFEYALSALRTAGFQDSEISILLHKNLVAKDHIAEKATSTTDGVPNSARVAHGTLFWLPGEGAVAAHSFEQFLFAGSIVAALPGIENDGASGGLAGALSWLGMSEEMAKQYQEMIEKCGILLFLNCNDPDRVDRATDSLRSTGAEGISTSATGRL